MKSHVLQIQTTLCVIDGESIHTTNSEPHVPITQLACYLTATVAHLYLYSILPCHLGANLRPLHSTQSSAYHQRSDLCSRMHILTLGPSDVCEGQVIGNLCPWDFSVVETAGRPQGRTEVEGKHIWNGVLFWGVTSSHSLETAMTAQDVAPGLSDQHAVDCQHVQPHLK